MPTVHREDGFRVVIWPSDHQPPHVHVFKAEAHAAVDIETRALRQVRGMQAADVTRAVSIVTANAEKLLAEWKEIHG